MEFLKGVLDPANDPRDFLPDALVPYFFDGGAVALLVILVGLVALVLKVGYKALEKRIEQILGDGRVLGIGLGYGLGAVVAGAGQRWAGMCFMLAVGGLALSNVGGLRAWLLRPLVVLSQVVVFVAVLGAESWWVGRDPGHTRYVLVLSFQHSHQSEPEVASLAKDYLLVLREAFKDVSTFEVVPENPTLLERLSLRAAPERDVLLRARRLVPRRRFCPAAILHPEVVFEQPGGRIRMSTRLHGLDTRTHRLAGALHWMPGWGDKSEIRYIALRTSHELLDTFKHLSCDDTLTELSTPGVRTGHQMGLADAEEAVVRRNILAGYKQFLVAHGGAQAIIDAVTEAMRAGTVDAQRLSGLLAQYQQDAKGVISDSRLDSSRCAAGAHLAGGC